MGWLGASFKIYNIHTSFLCYNICTMIAYFLLRQCGGITRFIIPYRFHVYTHTLKVMKLWKGNQYFLDCPKLVEWFYH